MCVCVCICACLYVRACACLHVSAFFGGARNIGLALDDPTC